MNIEIVIVMARILTVIIGVLCFLILYIADSEKWINTIKQGVDDYNKSPLTRRLQQSGWSEKMTPVKFRIYQCITAILGFSLPLSYNMSLPLCFIGCVLFWFFPPILLKEKIKKENIQMLEDIEHLYQLLQMLNISGSFFLDSLIDSYKLVRCWRLKKALIDLAGAITAKKDIVQAAEEFSGKFDNQHIKTLADIICYSASMGDVSSMLESVTEQINGIQKAQYIQEKGNQEFKEMIFLALLFIGGIAAIFYLHFTEVVSESNLLFWF